MRFVVIPVSSRAVYLHCINHARPTVVSVPAAAALLQRDPALLPHIIAAANAPPSPSPSTPSSSSSPSPPADLLDTYRDLFAAAFRGDAHPEEAATAAHGATVPASKTPRLDDRLVARAGKMWAAFESSPTAWKRRLVGAVNTLLARVPFEEAVLRSVPSKSAVLRKMRADAAKAKAEAQHSHISYTELEKTKESEGEGASPFALVEPIVVYYPASVVTPTQTFAAVRRLAEEGRVAHLRRMLACLAAAPLTLPVALLPVVPNVPGLYLAYRAWCNFRALEGARHLAYLCDGDGSYHLEFRASPTLDAIYKELGGGVTFDGTAERPEQVVLTEEMARPIEFLVESGDASSGLHTELVKAIRQTTKKIQEK